MEQNNAENSLNFNPDVTLYDLQNGFEYNVISKQNLTKENILDFTAALDITAEFYDVPACTIVKNAVPCGIALGTDIKDAFTKAFDCNSIAAIGAVAAFSQTITKETAKLAIQYQISSIIAPAFDDEALDVFKYHSEILLVEIKTPLNHYFNMVAKTTTVTPFGLLEEKIIQKNITAEGFKISSKTKPTQEQIEDMIFSYKIAKHLLNSCAVIVKDLKTISVIQAVSCLPDAIEWGVNRAIDGTKEAVCGINEPLNSTYAINAAVQGRISAIICPSKGEITPKIIELVDKYNISLAQIDLNG